MNQNLTEDQRDAIKLAIRQYTNTQQSRVEPTLTNVVLT
mgnify:CR=1 FL=1